MATLAGVLAAAIIGGCTTEHRASSTPLTTTETTMTMHTIRGEFEVKMLPQTDEGVSDAAIGRFALEKQFRGSLDAASKGQMLGFRSSVKGSAGYVAVERVVGVLEGKRGSFVLQHDGTMQGGELHLNIVVVPNSGTEELTGIRGTMKIEIVEGKHFYVFEYALP
ncbi:MAG: DUF3224 domain-containing protein [Phycisphaerales bacterium]|jgi:hypothetical protein